ELDAPNRLQQTEHDGPRGVRGVLRADRNACAAGRRALLLLAPGRPRTDIARRDGGLEGVPMKRSHILRAACAAALASALGFSPALAQQDRPELTVHLESG